MDVANVRDVFLALGCDHFGYNWVVTAPEKGEFIFEASPEWYVQEKK